MRSLSNTLAVVLLLCFLTLLVENLQVLLVVNGAILSNILMLMLPNALYLYQVNYGYLKYQESNYDYLVATFLFYLSAFNIIYTMFRAI